MPDPDPLAEARKRVEAAEEAKRKVKERSGGQAAPQPGFGEQLGAAWRWLRGPQREEKRPAPKRDNGKRR